MKPFMDENFLLHTSEAQDLYHGIAEFLPIIDYHCHLSPKEIAEDMRFANMTEVWLRADHYKWRAMRLNGVEEPLVTGPADDYDRFLAWADTVPVTLGNPLFHWTQLELKRYFNIDDVLSKGTAPDIWARANAVLARPEMSAQGFIARSNVKAVCTTDDPADDLKWHEMLRLDPTLTFRVLPTWRPDNALNADKPSFTAYISALGAAAGIEIRDWDGLIRALDGRLAYFAAIGCRLSDHSFERLPFEPCDEDEAASIFSRVLAGRPVSSLEADRYRTALILWLGKRYEELGWAMQLHMGAMRDNNTRMAEKLGPDSGYDAAADHPLAKSLRSLLDALERRGALPKTVLYALNPKDYYTIASLAGCYHGQGVPAKVQFGPAWWFADHINGIERHLGDLGSLGLLSRFVGMVTDSRCFLSFTRHEYFRRIFCDMLGQWVENGECPNDPAILEPLVRGVCVENAERFFAF